MQDSSHTDEVWVGDELAACGCKASQGGHEASASLRFHNFNPRCSRELSVNANDGYLLASRGRDLVGYRLGGVGRFREAVWE